VEIEPRGGHRGIAERLLDQVNGRTPVKAVAAMGVAQPMGRDFHGETSPLHDLSNARAVHTTLLGLAIDPRETVH
jgi:hypothetical protein